MKTTGPKSVDRCTRGISEMHVNKERGYVNVGASFVA